MVTAREKPGGGVDSTPPLAEIGLKKKQNLRPINFQFPEPAEADLSLRCIPYSLTGRLA